VRFALALLLAFCLWPQTTRSAEFDHTGLAQQSLERHIRPGYEQLLTAAQKLETALETFCGAPPSSDPEPVKEAFTVALLAWSRIEHLRFGPIQKKARHARMVFWPDRKGLGRRQVARALKARDKSVLSGETLQGKSVALQGFGALEYILFAKGHEQLSKPGPVRNHRCAFMQAIAANITHISQVVLKQWSGTGDYAATFLQPGPDNAVYLEPKEVTFEIAKSLIVGLERVRDIRIAGPLGLQRKSRRRRSAAFERSGLSTRVITANLEGLVDLFEKGGLMERIGAHELGMDKAIQFDLVQSLKQLRSISVPMKAAVEDPEMEDRLMAVGFPLRNAREEVSRVMADAAGLALGFNALDGD
jgi:hypothetical protein